MKKPALEQRTDPNIIKPPADSGVDANSWRDHLKMQWPAGLFSGTLRMCRDELRFVAGNHTVGEFSMTISRDTEISEISISENGRSIRVLIRGPGEYTFTESNTEIHSDDEQTRLLLNDFLIRLNLELQEKVQAARMQNIAAVSRHVAETGKGMII